MCKPNAKSDSRVNRPLEWRAGLGSERYAKILALQGAPFGLARKLLKRYKYCSLFCEV